MSKKEASKQLNIGYLLFGIGILIGYLLKGHDISPIFTGYIIWGTYWGYRLLYKRLKMYVSKSITNNPVVIIAESPMDFFKKIHEFNFFVEILIFFICYIIGTLGASIFMQIKLSKIAYF